MDRFIETQRKTSRVQLLRLKSNMDRFIASSNFFQYPKHQGLKSNMDRFIDADFDAHSVEVQKFKIQYG